MTALPRLAAERRAANEGALVHPRPDLAAFAVTGKDRLSWLNGLVTQDIGKLAPGAGAYGLAVGKTGKIMSELWFVAAPDRAYVIAPRDRVEAIRQHFDKHLIMEDAEIGEVLGREVVFAHGPRAKEIVTEARALGADAAMVDWTGRGDAAVIIALEGKAIDEALLAKLGDQGARAGDEAWEVIRIAWGLPRFGVDFDEATLPQEASLEKLAVSFTKGCYLGQETVFMLEKRGHARRRLCRIAIEGGEPPAAGAEIAIEGDGAVGSVTSAAPALEGEGTAALGYVKYKHASEGAALVIAGRPARVLGLAAAPRAATATP